METNGEVFSIFIRVIIIDVAPVALGLRVNSLWSTGVLDAFWDVVMPHAVIFWVIYLHIFISIY